MTSQPATTQVLVIAKAPVPGQVKTRLCPPCTPEQAASIAAAALADTLTVAGAVPAVRHTLVLRGSHTPPGGWTVVAQHGDGLGARLANAFADTALPGVASLLIGMDTPQITIALLTDVTDRLTHADAVLAPATDGGWWALALRDPTAATVLHTVPMSTPHTAAMTRTALIRLGLQVATASGLRDVDTVADARAVAGECPYGTFAAAVRDHIPAPTPC